MLELISIDSGYFPQPEGTTIIGCGHTLVPLVIEKDHRQLLVESAHHS